MNTLLCTLLSICAAFTPRRISLAPLKRRVAVGAVQPSQSAARLGHYVPSNPKAKAEYIKMLRRKAEEIGDNFVEPIKDLVSLVKQDPNLQAQFTLAFATARQFENSQTPLDTPAVRDFDEFVALLNAIVLHQAPCYMLDPDDPANPAAGDPAGLIAFPINTLLDWPMATNAGQGLFANSLLNRRFQKILNYWNTNFLTQEGSKYVLPAGSQPAGPNSLGWLDEKAKQHMVDVAFNFTGQFGVAIEDGVVKIGAPVPDGHRPAFEEVFDIPDPNDPCYGFHCWDDFFLRKFKYMYDGNDIQTGPRPVNGLHGYQPWPEYAQPPHDDPEMNANDPIILNACESAPLAIARGVEPSDQFWLKGQYYSLGDMLNYDHLADDERVEFAEQFYGGTVYQAFLSALSYHNWNMPVSGTIKKIVKIPGTYYLESIHTGFEAGFVDDKTDFSDGVPDFEAPNDSQKFLTAVASRMAIYIEADNPDIGLMCFLAVGMAEVSSTQALVEVGKHYKKGDPLGCFHYGGSTHCLIFRPETELEFWYDVPQGSETTLRPGYWYNTPVNIDATNVPVRAQIAKASAKDL